jgi:hypothetical protein
MASKMPDLKDLAPCWKLRHSVGYRRAATATARKIGPKAPSQ